MLSFTTHFMKSNLSFFLRTSIALNLEKDRKTFP